ncbi:toprim domain-containing protein [Patescibacteria group bacterium]|nr:toprim domain-containing protein [Patescibacteria group bacterium]
MNTIDKLAEQFSKLPGIGPRQAKRFVYFLLKKDDAFLKGLSENILKLKQDINTCESCYQFFQDKTKTSAKKCEICRDSTRDETVLMVVGKDADMENIEKNHIYNGKYFILGGYLPIMSNDASWVRSDKLFEIVKQRKDELKEVILALSLNPEGENTIYHVTRTLKPLTDKYPIKVSTLGKGLSTGTELEYSDDDTLKNALKNRS